MKTNAGKYLERPIGENEEELLEKYGTHFPPWKTMIKCWMKTIGT